MPSWFVLLLFGSLIIHAISRPQQAEYNNDSDVEETEEEDDSDSAADAYSADDEDTRLSDQEPAGQEEEVPRSRHLLDLTESRYLQRNSGDDHTARTKLDSLSDGKVSRNRDIHDENQSDSANFNEQVNQNLRTFPKRRQSNRYNDPNEEQQEIQQHLTNRDASKSNHAQNQDDNQVSKRTLEYETTANEEGDMIFEKNRDQISHINKNDYNPNDATDPEQLRYFKQYQNTIQSENRDLIDDKTHDAARYNVRDRRDVKEENVPESSDMPNIPGNKESNDKTDSEDEETAIKRHIRKLSSNELDQLLNSLTEEKRELLKKIIDDTEPNDNGYINKREITKKAGAVEENNYIENCQSDLSKIQGGSPSLDINTESAVSTNTDTTEISKQDCQTDNSETTQKTAESSLASVGNKLELPSHNDEGFQKKTDNLNTFSLNIDPKSQADVVGNVQVTSKTENKREANMEDFEEEDSIEDNKLTGPDYSNEQGYFCSQDDNLSVMDDENQPREEKNYKREAYYDKQLELSDSVKNLEESFPNSNAYDDSGPYSGPLVRVKRKSYDPIVKKRSAGLLPDAKVAYFPYKAENEDEDNDEGNEFDDEGFYDRTSNFANGNKGIEEDISDKSENSIQTKNLNVDSNSKSGNENESDTMSLGSDSDSVLSGVEGVDDNLMYNSAGRNRRTADDTSSDATQTKVDSSTSLMEDEVKSAHYQENDAFGPLPRNYDGDLARYKRIRRVKQLHNTQELNSSDN